MAANLSLTGPGGHAVVTLNSLENSLATMQLTLRSSVEYVILSPQKD